LKVEFLGRKHYYPLPPLNATIKTVIKDLAFNKLFLPPHMVDDYGLFLRKSGGSDNAPMRLSASFGPASCFDAGTWYNKKIS